MPTTHPKIRRLVCQPTSLHRVRHLLNELVRQADLLEPDQLKSLLKWAVPEYRPQLTNPHLSEGSENRTPPLPATETLAPVHQLAWQNAPSYASYNPSLRNFQQT